MLSLPALPPVPLCLAQLLLPIADKLHATYVQVPCLLLFSTASARCACGAFQHVHFVYWPWAS